MLCDPLTFVPVEERPLLWSVLERDDLFVEIPETFGDVRTAGKIELWKRHKPFVSSSTCEYFEGVDRFWLGSVLCLF